MSEQSPALKVQHGIFFAVMGVGIIALIVAALIFFGGYMT